MVEHTGPVENNVNTPQPAAEGGMRISFGVKRKETTKLVQAAVEVTRVAVDSDEEREREEEERQAKKRKLTHFEHGAAPKDDDEKEVKAVIPLVVENDWRVAKLLEKEKNGTITDEERARLAILTDGAPIPQMEEGQEGKKEAITIGGEEIKVSVDADYNVVPIDQFGLGILRGCGWKDGDGIGRVPQKIALQVSAQRPKGLGLGATPANPQKKSGKGEKGEDLNGEISKDHPVKITSGRHKNLYGKVEARDDDNNSLFVKLALGGQSVKVSLFAAQRVSVKEYEREAKCLNKSAYDSEKAKIDRKRNELEKEVRRKERRGNVDEDDIVVLDDAKEGSSRESEELWVRPELVVRFIDKEYSRGKLYKEKLRVIDVASRRDISLEDESGQIYYNLRQSWMETVIPRSDGGRIMVVRGRYTGLAAVMEKKDKKRDRVVARLLSNNKIVDLDFDDVCQFRPKYEEDYDL